MNGLLTSHLGLSAYRFLSGRFLNRHLRRRPWKKRAREIRKSNPVWAAVRSREPAGSDAKWRGGQCGGGVDSGALSLDLHCDADPRGPVPGPSARARGVNRLGDKPAARLPVSCKGENTARKPATSDGCRAGYCHRRSSRRRSEVLGLGFGPSEPASAGVVAEDGAGGGGLNPPGGAKHSKPAPLRRHAQPVAGVQPAEAPRGGSLQRIRTVQDQRPGRGGGETAPHLEGRKAKIKLRDSGISRAR